MSWDRIRGNWMQAVGRDKGDIGESMGDDMDLVAGRDYSADRHLKRHAMAGHEEMKDRVERERSNFDRRAKKIRQPGPDWS